jgi:hypothetical protein
LVKVQVALLVMALAVVAVLEELVPQELMALFMVVAVVVKELALLAQ